VGEVGVLVEARQKAREEPHDGDPDRCHHDDAEDGYECKHQGRLGQGMDGFPLCAKAKGRFARVNVDLGALLGAYNPNDGVAFWRLVQ